MAGTAQLLLQGVDNFSVMVTLVGFRGLKGTMSGKDVFEAVSVVITDTGLR